MIINMREWQKTLIASKNVGALPIMTYPGLSLTGYTILDVITNGEKQFDCMKILAEKYPSIASVAMMDLSVEAEAFGSRVLFSENEAPTVIGQRVANMETVRFLPVPKVGSGRTGVYLKATELAARQIKNKPVFGGLIGPFSLTGRLLEMKNLLLKIRREPEMVHALLGKTTRFLVEYARAIKATGANGLIMAEPAAGLVGPSDCDEFSSKYVKQIVDAVQDGSFMVILHNCGNTVPLVKSMLSTGAAGLHFGNAVRMADVMPQIPADRLAFGNIDPSGLFRIGTRKHMEEKVSELLDEVGDYRNFVLSSGCDIPPGTPLDNIDAFFDALDLYNLHIEEMAS